MHCIQFLKKHEKNVTAMRCMKNTKSLHFILAQSGTSIEFRPLSFKLLLSSPVTQSAQVIICGNKKHNYLNAIKAEQLMVGKQLPISTSLHFFS